MGNQTTTKKEDIVEIQLSHPKFSNTKLIKNGDIVQLQTKIGVDQKDYQRWLKQVTTPKFGQNTHLLLPLSQEFVSNNLCGSSGTAIINYDYYPYLLSQQIYNRSGKRTKFQQTDLWYLLFSLVSAKAQISNYFTNTTQKKIITSLGDIRASNIFLNDQGKVKIANLLSWPNQQRAWQKALDKQNGVYLAPQDFQRLSKGQNQDDSNINNQIFSIGMVMLGSGILLNEDSNSQEGELAGLRAPHLYDYKKMAFNHTEYERRVFEWIFTRGYSDVLKGVVLNLVQLNPQSRLTAAQLWQFISKHQKHILERQNFVIDNAPLKVHQAVLKYRQIKSKGNPVQPLQQFKSFQLQKSVVVKHEISDVSLHERNLKLQQNESKTNESKTNETFNLAEKNTQGVQGQ